MTDPSLISTLRSIREQLSIEMYNWSDEQEMMYNHGWDDCLNEMDKIIDEMEHSSGTNTPIVPDETMEEILKNGVKND